jgi:hypothetical protein
VCDITVALFIYMSAMSLKALGHKRNHVGFSVIPFHRRCGTA